MSCSVLVLSFFYRVRDFRFWFCWAIGKAVRLGLYSRGEHVRLSSIPSLVNSSLHTTDERPESESGFAFSTIRPSIQPSNCRTHSCLLTMTWLHPRSYRPCPSFLTPYPTSHFHLHICCAPILSAGFECLVCLQARPGRVDWRQGSR
jgi:hypothetical protein